MESIEKRFGGNTETKKVQKTFLKQQYENFIGSSSESLDQIHDRLQKLVSQLEIHGTDLEKQSLDDLFNSLKIYEAEVKHSSSTGTTTQNLAFVSSSNTDSTTESVSAAASISSVYAKMFVSSLPNVDSLKEDPTNFALMAFSSSSSSSNNEVVSCSKACSKAYAKVPSQYDKLTTDFCKLQFDVISYPTGLESIEARLLVYKQNESVFEEDIKLLKLEVQLRDNALVTLRQKLEKAEQERDDLKLKLEKFQTSSKNLTEFLASQTNEKIGLGYNSHVFTRVMFDYDDYLSLESDESWPPSSLYDRFQSSDGYHVVPPPYTGTFMPPKPDLVFNTAPNDAETDHPAFIVKLSPTKSDQDLSLTNKPSAPIIEDWVSDSEDESETKAPQIDPSFVQSPEQVKSPRHSIQHVEPSIPIATPKPSSPKPTSNGTRRNRKACFVCKSLDHLIKDCDYHEKKMAQHTTRNHEHRVFTKSKPVSFTTIRQVSNIVPKIKVTRPKQAKPIITKTILPTRRNLTRSPSPKASTTPPRVTTIKALVGNPQHAFKDKGVIDSRCSRHMTKNMSYLSNFEELNGGYVTFGGNPKGGKISRKGKIRTVLLRVLRENNMYNVNLQNIVPSGDLTCLFAKSTLDESNLWHRRLGHINFKTMNKLVKCNLVRGLPTNVFENDNTCVACKKGKQHRASCKTKPVSSVDQPLYRLHMDLFGPTFVKSLNKKSYCLVVTDDYSRFTWVFFLAAKDETSPILKTFITGLENQLSLKVKVIISDNGTEFKNNNLNQFCEMKGIKREFNSLLPIPFWAEAVNTTCYVQNRVLVTKPHNKTLYELLRGRTQSIGFIRPFGCTVTILNTLDSLGKFKGKVDEGFLVGYYVNSSGPTWLFDIDSLTKTMNYQPVTAGNQSIPSAGFQDKFDAKKQGRKLTNNISAQSRKQDDKTKKEAKGKSPVESFIRYRDLSAEFKDYSNNSINEVNATGTLVPTIGQISPNSTKTFSIAGPSNVVASPTHEKSSFIDASQLPNDLDMPELEDITYSDDVGAKVDFNNSETSITVSHIPTTRVHKDHPVTQIIGDLSSATQTRSTSRVAKDQGGLSHILNDDFHSCMFSCFFSQEEPKRVFRNKKDERGTVIKNKARLVAQGHTQEEGIDYKEVFTPVARIEAIRLFLAYASFMGFMVYQIDVKSAFLYGTIKVEVYVCQPPGFEDPCHPDKVYKVVKALYGLRQTPRACQDKYVAEILRKFGLTEGKSASTPIDTEKPLLKDPDGEDVDMHTYRLMIGSLMYLTSSRPDIMFAVNDIIRLQALVDKKKVVVTEATIREALHLDYAKVVECLPNEEIFVELARMGYEKPSTKLTFYKALFSSQWKKQVGNLSTHSTKYTSPALTHKVFANMRRVVEEGDADENDEHINGGDTVKGDVSATHGEVPTVVEEPSIPSPTPSTSPPQPSQDIPSTYQVQPTPPQSPQRVKKLERRNKVRVLKLRRFQKVGTTQRVETSDDTIMDDVSNQGRMIADMDVDADVVLEEAKEEPKPLKKKQQIKQDEKYVRELQAELNKNIDWDEAIDYVKKKAKEDPTVKRYQVLKRKPQTEVQARKNMMVYLKNVAGFKMDYFKGMSYDDIQKAVKRQKLDERVEELKRHLQIVPNEDDDVYTEATLLARKVPVVDYQIIKLNNKPYYKIIRADDTYQLYPKNFSDDFLLVTLGEMFKKPDIHAQIWKNQRSVHGPAKVKEWKLLESCDVLIITFITTQLILLVERKYPLTRFTLDQMLNAVRLEVEEESEVSLELLSFGVDAAKELKKNMLSV
nr:hypothetical protein [Tanacetum cinerariifolium]